MIKLSKPYIGTEELEEIKKVMESGCAAGTCPEVTKFEEKFAEFVGSKYAVATSSATTALHLACLALNIGKGSKAVCPSYTFPATGFAPLYTGANLEIVDVEPDTFNLDVETLPHEYRPDVIIPVHCFGNPADMCMIEDYAIENDTKIIEDAACAIPAYHESKHAGTRGDIGCYSFYAIKNLCTGEGGMLVTDNEEIAEKARSLCDFGKTTTKPLPKFTQLGYNYRLSAIQAAMGLEQIKKLPWMHKQRIRIAQLYNKFIEDELSGFVAPQVIMDGCTSAYQRYAVVLSQKIDRDKVIEDIARKGVQTTIGTYCLSSQPYFKDYKNENPVSRMLFNQSISLPMYPELTEIEVQIVCNTLKECVLH